MTQQQVPTTPRSRAESLRGLCGGSVHLPGDPAYDMARSPWNLQVVDLPAAVTYPAFPDEVAEVLRAATAAGLAVAPQGTGHGAPPLEGRLTDAVLVRTSAMTELHVDADRRLARVGAGVLWGDLTDAAGRHGLAARHPSSPDVGVVGYTLGGGIGWYARRLGLQCNAVTAMELVLADGSVVRATAEQEADLFWALRGGAAPLGVVTALEFELFPLDTVVAGFLAWDATAVERVLPAWVTWCSDAPEEATTAFRLLDVPDIEEMPTDLRGRRIAMIDGAVLGPDDAAADVLAPLRALRPELDTVGRVPAASLVRLHLDPEGPTPAYTSSRLVEELPDAAVAAFIEAVGPASRSRLAVAELRQLGGALSRPDPAGGALSSLDGRFLALGLGLEGGMGDWAQLRADAAAFLAALEPWTRGRHYLPMLDDRVDTRKAFPPGVHARLSAIRRRVDPGELFLDPHPALPRT
ncbi:FAD-binding oxidoreductase [Geodermatophilus obscurus]|uniref:FAD linked oxidase domain protein n=1 Tax=Geodermatophilus obscurus (strain ATCC 25078 / DSM 43160 / JCM 3152 / CCUG 61914 / KCC A-0152 / KCTC 9177 / NBRC 13315 / NRRL B-3577 / G-20) TaxID=526225 RepID=D2SCV2_GEOOG|nr:FAD-binding oxidoreductase [Geodermatophilus obscurus]ADB74337.1 FAD linked oxidase domain protein [Geodermatophilus obscurus DSM 43160]